MRMATPCSNCRRLQQRHEQQRHQWQRYTQQQEAERLREYEHHVGALLRIVRHQDLEIERLHERVATLQQQPERQNEQQQQLDQPLIESDVAVSSSEVKDGSTQTEFAQVQFRVEAPERPYCRADNTRCRAQHQATSCGNEGVRFPSVKVSKWNRNDRGDGSDVVSRCDQELVDHLPFSDDLTSSSLVEPQVTSTTFRTHILTRLRDAKRRCEDGDDNSVAAAHPLEPSVLQTAPLRGSFHSSTISHHLPTCDLHKQQVMPRQVTGMVSTVHENPRRRASNSQISPHLRHDHPLCGGIVPNAA